MTAALGLLAVEAAVPVLHLPFRVSAPVVLVVVGITATAIATMEMSCLREAKAVSNASSAAVAVVVAATTALTPATTVVSCLHEAKGVFNATTVAVAVASTGATATATATTTHPHEAEAGCNATTDRLGGLEGRWAVRAVILLLGAGTMLSWGAMIALPWDGTLTTT